MRLLFPLILLICGCEKTPSEYTSPRRYEFTLPEKKVPHPIGTPKPVVSATAWGTFGIRKDKLHAAQALVAKIEMYQPNYQFVSNRTTVPWDVIGGIHYRECDLSFRQNLANGDPLTAPTRHVPKGRPPNVKFPVSWETAAVDAIQFDRLNKQQWLTSTQTLNNVEAYNGLGYQQRGLPSPYLWSWTDRYKKGKYVADGKFDPDAIDEQCGVAPILKLCR